MCIRKTCLGTTFHKTGWCVERSAQTGTVQPHYNAIFGSIKEDCVISETML